MGHIKRLYIGRDADGKQLFKYVTKDGLKECKDAAREIEQELVDGKLTKIPNMKLSAWITQWMEINQGRLSPLPLPYIGHTKRTIGLILEDTS